MFGKKQVLLAGLAALAIMVSAATVRAQTALVAPTLRVTPHSYDAPLNEQPFYGFLPKSAAMLAADRHFIEAVGKDPGRDAGAEEFAAIGWAAVKNGDYALAAKRFNQAWLLDPESSSPVHGLAVIASARFDDNAFALELLDGAARLKKPLPSLPGDHGGLLIRAGKPDQAIPYLETAANAFPDWINPQINLATAKYETGDVRDACRYLDKVEHLLAARPAARSAIIDSVYRPLSEKARCASL